ncbi:SDR family oxidoreductase [Pseudonocardia kongjuensis]|uniref:SDR family oxidoreductase n=1 Tax=Pseudonocardia kongjuensis TaxID=102227 RepID=A0ABN1XQY6_9PSEU
MARVLITGSGTGMGRLAARTLAARGHTVYASMRDPRGRNRTRAADLEGWAGEHGHDLRVVELDVLDEASAAAAVGQVVERSGGLDVVVHNAAHLYVGITEAFDPEQVLCAFDTNAVGALRVNRAVLPVMRRQRSGLLVWVGSGTSFVVPPFLAPYTAAKAAFDSFAESVAVEVARYGIETSIVAPGPFTEGTEHFPNAAAPRDEQVADAYRELYGETLARNGEATEGLFPAGVEQDVQAVADEIARVVGLPRGSRPYRTSVDFSDFGDEPVSAVSVAQRARLLTRMGLADVLDPVGHGAE